MGLAGLPVELLVSTEQLTKAAVAVLVQTDLLVPVVVVLLLYDILLQTH